jgi:hypothetical protein
MKGINIAPLPNKDIKTQKNKYILVQFKGGGRSYGFGAYSTDIVLPVMSPAVVEATYGCGGCFRRAIACHPCIKLYHYMKFSFKRKKNSICRRVQSCIVGF